MTTLLASTVDVTVVLALALVAGAALKRRSAALRHVVLAAAIVGAVLSPAIELLVPQLPVIHWSDSAPVASSAMIVTSAEAPSESGAIASAAPETPAIPWTTLLLTAWMLGATVTLAGLLTGLVRLSRLTARCPPVPKGRWREMADELSLEYAVRRPVALLQSADPSLLVTCGVLRPKIILPAGAASWTDDRRRIVLAHEIAHIRRHDGALQIVGEVLRAIHWFNPLVWLACRRLRQESEYACDDAVLSEGIEPTEYATHLLDVARHVGRHHAWASAPAIADPSTLERRVSAMLNRQRNREPLTRRARAVAALAAAAVIVPLAAAGVAPKQAPVTISATVRDVSDGGVPGVNVTITATTVTAQQAQAAITGAVLDQSGGALPGAMLTLTDTGSGARYTTLSDGDGRFAFRDLPPARYELGAGFTSYTMSTVVPVPAGTVFPGFTTISAVVPLAAGATVARTIVLPLGTVETSVTVVGCVAAPVATAAPQAPSVAVRTAPSTARALPSRLRQAWNRTLQAIAPVLSAQQQLPVRIGGQIRALTKVVDVKPGCPTTPIPTTGAVVRLVGRIGVNGSMKELTPIAAEPGAAPPVAFIESALAAVRQWKYTPALLNGEPVEVNITIRVQFMRMTSPVTFRF